MQLEQRKRQIEDLQQALPQLEWIQDAAKVKRLSRDFHWFSPVLKQQLAEKTADCAVRPQDISELQQVVSHCARRQLPLMIRGAGTGNYGQLVPLDGGVMVDFGQLNQLVEHRGGAVRAQAGIRLGELEAAVRPAGWELRCMPSTWRQATLGGLYCGGFGGVGSINYGPLAAPGNVLSVTVMTMEVEPRIIHLSAPQALLLHHSYGSNGIILEVELALAPVQDWIERLDVFANFTDASEYAQALARSPGLVKRQLALMAAPIPDYFPGMKTRYQPGQHAVISLMARQSDGLCAGMLSQFHGRNAVHQSSEQAHKENRSLIEFCWNHTTLHALSRDKSLTYLQTAFDPQCFEQQIATLDVLLAGEVMSHIEFLRDNEGTLTCSGLQLVRFTDEARLNAIMQIFRDHGVKINNPHVYQIEDGKQGMIRPEVVAVKQAYDPAGLLNPGKLRGWDQRHHLL